MLSESISNRSESYSCPTHSLSTLSRPPGLHFHSLVFVSLASAPSRQSLCPEQLPLLCCQIFFDVWDSRGSRGHQLGSSGDPSHFYFWLRIHQCFTTVDFRASRTATKLFCVSFYHICVFVYMIKLFTNFCTLFIFPRSLRAQNFSTYFSSLNSDSILGIHDSPLFRTRLSVRGLSMFLPSFELDENA